MSSIKSITVNFNTNVRTEYIDEVEYIVVPMIMINEGVLNGLYYPKEEIAKFPEAWNGEPISIKHPENNKEHVSCNSPEVLKKYKIGTVFNTKYEDSKLKAEAWLQKNKLEVLAPGLLSRILSNVPTDVSTGVYVELKEGSGEFNGKKYNAIAINYRPDHLAILIDEKGACSWKDGAGIPRINKDNNPTEENNMVEKETKKEDVPVFNKEQSAFVSELIVNALKEYDEKKKAEAEELKANAEKEAQEKAEAEKPEVNKEEKVEEKIRFNSIDDVYEAVPSEIAETLKYAVNKIKEERAEHIEKITANKKNSFTKEQLENKPMEELKAISALAVNESYEGKNNLPRANAEEKLASASPSLVDFIKNKNKENK